MTAQELNKEFLDDNLENNSNLKEALRGIKVDVFKGKSDSLVKLRSISLENSILLRCFRLLGYEAYVMNSSYIKVIVPTKEVSVVRQVPKGRILRPKP